MKEMDNFTFQNELTMEQRAHLSAEIFAWGMAMFAHDREKAESHQFVVSIIPTLCMGGTTPDEKKQILAAIATRIGGTPEDLGSMLAISGMMCLRQALKMKSKVDNLRHEEASNAVEELKRALPSL